MAWYDGATRTVELNARTAISYRSGKPTVTIYRPLIRDPQNTFDPMAVLGTDPAVDDTNATVTWYAVDHVTSYEVSRSSESSGWLSTIAGTVPSVTSTSATIQHDASEQMTLTVTVIPEYVDKNGDTQQLSNLASTATLAIGPVGEDAQAESEPAIDTPPPDCVSDAILNKVRHYYEINQHRVPVTARTGGDLSDANLTPFTATEARVRESTWFV